MKKRLLMIACVMLTISSGYAQQNTESKKKDLLSQLSSTTIVINTGTHRNHQQHPAAIHHAPLNLSMGKDPEKEIENGIHIYHLSPSLKRLKPTAAISTNLWK